MALHNPPKGLKRWLTTLALRTPPSGKMTDGQLQAEVNMANYLVKGHW